MQLLEDALLAPTRKAPVDGCSSSRTLWAAVATVHRSEPSRGQQRESVGILALSQRERLDELARWAASSAIVHRIKSGVAFKELNLKCKQNLVMTRN